jgi:argininosuccinate lyase
VADVASGGRLWGGRFSASPAEAFDRLNASLPVDRRMWPEDVACSRAHARMLGACGVISPEDAAAIDDGLTRVAAELESGELVFAPGDEDIHTAIERRLTELIGDPGRRLHTARSRNDQVATDVLMYLRNRCDVQAGLLAGLVRTLLDRAEAEVETLMPGMTHQQHAQPVRLAHHLLAYVWMLARDRARLAAVLDACRECPLGSGALAGVSFPIDRQMVAEELGFSRPSPNSMDAVSSRDALADYLHFAGLLGVHLSRLGAEIVMWASDDVGFVRLDDAFSSGSSMLPQKKNPDVAELARAKAHRLAAAGAGLAGTVSGLPLAYAKDLQEDKTYLFDAIDTVELLLPAMTGMIETLEFRRESMGRAARGGFLGATDLADALVGQGWTFREAHGAVGSLVAQLSAAGRDLSSATSADLAAAGVSDVDPARLHADAVVESKRVAGGTARDAVRAQLAAAREEVEGW